MICGVKRVNPWCIIVEQYVEPGYYLLNFFLLIMLIVLAIGSYRPEDYFWFSRVYLKVHSYCYI